MVITPAEYRAQANSAFAGDQFLEVAATAGPSGFSNGKNYVVYNYFKLNSLTYIGNDQTYSTTQQLRVPRVWGEPVWLRRLRDHRGTNAPGGIILLQDNVNPTQPWGLTSLWEVSAEQALGRLQRNLPWNPAVGPFETVLWNVNGSTVQPY